MVYIMFQVKKKQKKLPIVIFVVLTFSDLISRCALLKRSPKTLQMPQNHKRIHHQQNRLKSMIYYIWLDPIHTIPFTFTIRLQAKFKYFKSIDQLRLHFTFTSRIQWFHHTSSTTMRWWFNDFIICIHSLVMPFLSTLLLLFIWNPS